MNKAVIMLVEDEKSLASFLITELELEGYEVIWAKDGREALKIFKEKEITLILLDWMLLFMMVSQFYAEFGNQVMCRLL